MREILFRALWADDSEGVKEWVYGYLYQDDDGDYIIQKGKDRTGYILSREECKTIGQYTGLKDKNGKEIYEGDIVYCINADVFQKKGVVKFGDGTTMFYIYQGDGCRRPLLQGWRDNQLTEIVGNIHENPELIER